MFRIKICGITNIDDALVVQAGGADALGLIFCPSPRQVDAETARSIHQALGPEILRVGVFRGQTAEEIRRLAEYCGLDYIQLHGDETPEWADGLSLPYIKSLSVGQDSPSPKDMKWRDSRADAVILDSPGGGSGKTFDWSAFSQFRAIGKPLILAGGLNAGNVGEAIINHHPDGVDVGSGVEAAPGRKDYDKIRDFMAAAVEAYRHLQEG